ncbi:MAG: hypothetical protein HUJ54_04400 [Erysipelotrichaceae bacterium]|nr:hypothetical protein [Erysipelotrichaceae bacterium]
MKNNKLLLPFVPVVLSGAIAVPALISLTECTQAKNSQAITETTCQTAEYAVQSDSAAFTAAAVRTVSNIFHGPDSVKSPPPLISDDFIHRALRWLGNLANDNPIMR